MSHLELIILCLVGIVSGFLNVMAGGGSMLTMPVMIFMGMPGHIANGTNRIAILAQNITAVVAFYRKGFANFKLSLSLALCAIPGAALGAYLATQIAGQNFKQLLAVIMVLVMLLMWFDKPQKQQAAPIELSRKRWLWGHFLMMFAGFWGGFIQIGVGFILMPILHRVMGFDLVTTNSHKVFIVLMFSIAALLVFSSQLELFWIAGLCLAVGNSIGGWIGANYQIKQGANAIKWVLNIVLVMFIIKLLFTTG